jgi:hypothetical protein
MKTKIALVALSLLSGVFAAEASAKPTVYIPHQSTVVRLCDQAEVVVVGKLARTENIDIGEQGIDFAEFPNKGDAKHADGQPFVRREAVITVSQTLKGDSFVTGGELRVISIRQMQFDNYDDDLKAGNAIYFAFRRADGRLVVHSQERGTVSAEANGGDLNGAIDFTRDYLAASQTPATRFAAIKNSLLASIKLNGSRLSVDAALEFSWHFNDYKTLLTPQDTQQLMNAAKLATPGSDERIELITTIGRYKPDGAMPELLAMILSDATFTTTSIAAWAMEEIDKKVAVDMLNASFDGAALTQQMLAVRALGLIHPKDWFEGEAARATACNHVISLLNSGDETCVLEALVAGRSLWAGKELGATLKNMIDNRATNGLSENALKGAIIVLATYRTKVTQAQGVVEVIHEKAYLNNLALQEPVLKQVVDCALLFPYTSLITDAQGRLR